MLRVVADSIDGRGEAVRQLFFDRRYQLDSYQREFTWQRTQVLQLLHDLRRRFLAAWRTDHTREQVSGYPQYFLGPYVYYQERGITYLIDGQQRLTTLHLLLLRVRQLLVDHGQADDAAELSTLIRRREYGKNAYTIDIAERELLLDALVKGELLPPANEASPSVRALHSAAVTLDEEFPSELKGEALLYFHDWLLRRVCLVGIRAPGREQGWEIFETMNDRGVRAGPIDLLKTFLLARSVEAQRQGLDASWRGVVSKLSILDGAGASDFVKALLIGRYARAVREDGGDRSRINGAFHEWVRENHEQMGLRKSSDFAAFVARDFVRLGGAYGDLLSATRHPVEGLEPLFYNAVNGIDLQMHLIFAALLPQDEADVVTEKARLIAAFLDLLFVHRLVSAHAQHGSDLNDDVYRLVPLLRACVTPQDVADTLAPEIAKEWNGFEDFAAYSLGPSNRRHVRYILARMTAFTETGLKRPDLIDTYLNEPYQVEHIWAVHFDRYSDQVRTEDEFHSWRNRLGALLLLPRSDNASYSDDPYQKKVSYYRNQHVLAASLHPETHIKNKPLKTFLTRHGLSDLVNPSADDFAVSDIRLRQRLYQRLCQIIWDPERLGFTGHATTAPRQRTRTRARYNVTFADLIEHGLLAGGVRIVGQHKGVDHWATVLEDGRIKVDTGEIYNSPSTAAAAVTRRQSYNGWDFWRAQTRDGLTPIKDLRSIHLRARRVEG